MNTVVNTEEKARVLGFEVATELSVEELEQVSGGHSGPYLTRIGRTSVLDQAE
ncbi:hypothetical protein ACO0LF_10645 [Undibacterium sp. Di27W]|uniref:hypothetical protein n=1 Tax=Undibacterium sp. Di27W TaxID=3413036 RepID=UPI003BF0E645